MRRAQQTVDISLAKRIPLKQRLNLQLRADAFNLLNSPQLGFPNANIGFANGGPHHHDRRGQPARCSSRRKWTGSASVRDRRPAGDGVDGRVVSRGAGRRSAQLGRSPLRDVVAP